MAQPVTLTDGPAQPVHVIDYPDSLVADLAAQLGSSSASSAPSLARGAVSFTYDDGWDTHPTVAQGHADRGQLATFYVTTGLLSTSQHMPTAAVASIFGMGHEIGAHAVTHVSMTGLTTATRPAQYDNSRTALEALTGAPVRSWAYPLGDNSLATNQELYGRYDRVANIGLTQGYNRSPWLLAPDFSGFIHGRFPWSPASHPQLMALLDVVRRTGLVLSVYTHQIGNPDSPTLAQWTEAADYCKANGIPCIRADQATPGPLLANPGFEQDLAGWTVLNAGAAASGTTVSVVNDAPAEGFPGTKSLRIVSPNTIAATDSVHVFQVVPARPNTGYTVSARVRHDGTPVGTGKFSVRVNEFNSQGVTVASRNVRGTASTTAWTQSLVATGAAADATNYVAAGRTHPDTRYLQVGLYVQEITGTFYADHVHVGLTADGVLG